MNRLLDWVKRKQQSCSICSNQLTIYQTFDTCIVFSLRFFLWNSIKGSVTKALIGIMHFCLCQLLTWNSKVIQLLDLWKKKSLKYFFHTFSVTTFEMQCPSIVHEYNDLKKKNKISCVLCLSCHIFTFVLFFPILRQCDSVLDWEFSTIVLTAERFWFEKQPPKWRHSLPPVLISSVVST